MTDANDQEETRKFTLPEAIKAGIQAAMSEARFCLPGRVKSYDKKTQKCSVQPDFKRDYAGKVVAMPMIYNVPVAWPRSGDAWIHFPLKKDDRVTLIFCDRSIEKWLANGEINNPDDKRMHHLSDAFAFPGGYPFNDPASVNNGDDIIIMNGKSNEWRIKKNGHFQILNSKNEFVKVIYDMLTTIRAAVVYAGDAGAQPLRHYKFSEIQNRLKTFLEG